MFVCLGMIANPLFFFFVFPKHNAIVNSSKMDMIQNYLQTMNVKLLDHEFMLALIKNKLIKYILALISINPGYCHVIHITALITHSEKNGVAHKHFVVLIHKR